MSVAHGIADHRPRSSDAETQKHAPSEPSRASFCHMLASQPPDRAATVLSPKGRWIVCVAVDRGEVPIERSAASSGSRPVRRVRRYVRRSCEDRRVRGLDGLVARTEPRGFSRPAQCPRRCRACSAAFSPQQGQVVCLIRSPLAGPPGPRSPGTRYGHYRALPSPGGDPLTLCIVSSSLSSSLPPCRGIRGGCPRGRGQQEADSGSNTNSGPLIDSASDYLTVSSNHPQRRRWHQALFSPPWRPQRHMTTELYVIRRWVRDR